MGLVSMVISIFAVLTFHPLGNEVANAIIFPLLSLTYMALLLFAEHHEDKLEKRIKTLEKKLEDKEKGGGE
jgi:hypothetical protein